VDDIYGMRQVTEKHTPKETVVGSEFQRAIAYINTLLPADVAVRYESFDFLGIAKRNKGVNVLDMLCHQTDDAFELCGLFDNGGGCVGGGIGFCCAFCCVCVAVLRAYTCTAMLTPPPALYFFPMLLH